MNYFLLLLTFGMSTLAYSQGECMMVYESHHYVTNSTSDTVVILVNNSDQENFPTKGPTKFIIAPNERVEVSDLEWAEEFRDPTQWYVFKVEPAGLTRLCDSKNWSFEQLSETQGEYSLSLTPTDEGKCVMDKNSMFSGELVMPTVTSQKAEKDIFDIAEFDAEFPGGAQALFTWIGDNVNYPQKAIQDGVSGKVYVQFVIEKDGELSNVIILRSPSELLSEEVIRLVNAMPNWKPGKSKGEAVRLRYNLPITFTL